MNIEARWSGSYPTLCFGHWTLLIDGEDVSEKIPEDLRDRSMNTFGTYWSWHFNDEYIEEFDSYEDGMHCDEWIEENDYWLKDITDDYSVKEEIYDAFNADDFRAGSCGGCI